MFSGLVALILGGLVLAIGVRGMWRGWSSRTWESREGTILESTVHEQVRRNTGQLAYEARIVYQYADDTGALRTSERVTCGFSGPGRRAKAEALVERYPVGSSVRVYFDPRRPEFTILEPGIAGNNAYAVALLGAAFVVIGGLILAKA